MRRSRVRLLSPAPIPPAEPRSAETTKPAACGLFRRRLLVNPGRPCARRAIAASTQAAPAIPHREPRPAHRRRLRQRRHGRAQPLVQQQEQRLAADRGEHERVAGEVVAAGVAPRGAKHGCGPEGEFPACREKCFPPARFRSSSLDIQHPCGLASTSPARPTELSTVAVDSWSTGRENPSSRPLARYREAYLGNPERPP